MSEFHELTVSDVTPEGRDAVCLTIDVPQDLREAFAFTPGQYLTLRATIDGEDLRRPYSICSTPGAPLQVGVRRVADGRFSTFVNALGAGAKISVMPPDGRFLAEPGAPSNYLLIAAGSGITPMLSIAEATLAGSPDAQVTLVYGNRETATIMFRERLSDLKDRYLGRLTVIYLLSREGQDVELFNGRIDATKLRALSDARLIDPKGADAVFLCGPGTMIEMAELELTLMGVAPARIRAERFLPADGQAPRAPPEATQQAVAKGVMVEAILDGRRRSFTHADPEQPVLETARTAGIDLPHSCTGGMCCTCRCRIVEGSAEMAVNYSLQQWEIDAGFTLACQARPTSARLLLDFDAV